MIKAAIAGATGYTGLELISILNGHPSVELAQLTTESQEGKKLSDIAPQFLGVVDMTLERLKEGIQDEVDVLFLCLPHTASMNWVPKLTGGKCRIIDLSADFRLNDVKVYESWYHTEHKAKTYLENAVYGLPEIHREKIKTATLLANPGCYPTCVTLALLPLLKSGWVDLDSIVADCKSGVSGAGKKLSLATHFCEAAEGVKPYGLTEHRHTPEIEQELSLFAGRDMWISFSPHLMPMVRGMLSTVYIDLFEKVPPDTIDEMYRSFYRDEPFVRVLAKGEPANTHYVSGTNFCDIGVALDSRVNRLILTSAIDNLIKGASGQAVQNMNLMFGLDETSGLKT